ncbi:Ig-like domain-containing protein [Szabonella alba]|uniref:Ig-like domain-containing protein n=1 Tax=Szabonella alba TaxID=2804194 RepID=UPI001F2CF96D|nr:Ig-like domain-containing protein [Szabonella alba]
MAEGASFTERWTVASLDGTASTTITVTVTGTNDDPVIGANSDLTASVTELADGAAGENSFEHGRTGFIHFTDVDLLDTQHEVTVVPQGAGYLGDFTWTDINDVSDRLQWQFTVNDAVLDSLPAGESLEQVYEVTITDPNGGTATTEVTVTIQGRNDRPVPQADQSLTEADMPVSANVVANDSDVDAGETATLQVTQVAGVPVVAGGAAVEVFDGGQLLGTVSLTGRGDLTFTPAAGVIGRVDLPYTVDDGSGTVNATAIGTWTVNVIGVDIVDDTSPGTPGTGDNVLASIDDLGAVEILGQAPVDGTVTGLTVSDGVNPSVVIDPAQIILNPDGSFTVTADLSGLDDGMLTVSMEVSDGTNSITTTDEILKDTVTEVVIDPVLIVEGETPVITGTAEAGATVTLTVNGEEYETVADGNGDWSVTLDAPLDGDGVFITADAEDIWGNTDTNTREVSGLTLFDTDPGDPAHVVVHEAGLAGGTTPGDGRDRVESTLIIAGGASDLDRLVFGGSIVGGAVVGGTTVTAAELAAATIVDPVDILTDHGTISITAYDASLGIISYTYTLNGAITHDAAEGEGGIIRETIQIAVVETDGDIRAGNLVAAVVDDAPLDPVGEAPVGVIENEGPISGNVLSNDSATLGADGGRLHDITFTNRAGLSQTEEIPEGGPVTVETQYGELTISSDGFWTFTPVASANHVQPGNDAQLQDGFTYRTIDGDGDISAASANQPIVVLDTFAELGDPTDQTINESALPSGSAPDAPGQTVTGTLDVIPGADTFRVRFDIAQTAPVGQTAGGEQLEYVVSGGADANILTAYAGPGRTEADRIFVVTITDPTAANAGYSFQLLRPLDHLPDPVTGDTPDIDLGFDVIVTDSDGDSDAAMFNVTVVDDPQSDTLAFTITEDGSQNFNTSADASGDNTVIRDEAGTAITGMPVAGGTSYALPNGVAVVHPDGSVTYTPAPNFSGTEVFEFATTENGVTSVTTVTMTVDPVADAPVVTADAAAINTLEDTAVALGLNAPVIADDGTGAGNNTQSERLGTITLSGLPEGAVLQSGGITHTVLAGGTVTIVLSDMDTITGATGTLTMTSAEFEALTVLPPPHRHENFTVTMSVTSFEVDGSGTPVGLGATATTDVDVNVLAVTDEVALTFVGGTIEETFTINEDSTLDVTAQLLAAFDDIDGSELRSFTVINGSGGLIVVNGVTVPLGGEFEIPAPLLSNGTAGIPPIAIGALSNFSGDLNGITVRLNAQDRDGDSPSATPATETDSVTLNLRVNPVAGDVVAGNVTTTEDTAVAFLQDLRVTDTSIGAGGTEVITQVAFEVPAGWSMSSPPNNGTWTVDLIGDLYTIDFNGGTRAEREAVLDGFTITPPNHSSADVTISLSVTTEDSATVNGAPEVSTEVTTLPVTITVTPVAELVGGDSDGNATPDLTMTLGHIYSSGITGEEDEWFALNADGFDLSAGWTNEDTDEATFALLTPVLVEGDSATTSAIGSRFSWIDPVDGPQEVVFNGTPVEIPVAALGSVQFMAPEDASGEFRIGVQTRTVDPDADDPATTVTADSGQAWLDGIVILPVADDVTLNIRARASGPEDTEIPLAIRPSSSDLSETFNVTIADIPVDAVLRYDGNILDTSSGSVTILDFDQTLPLTIQPPLHSNVDFPLTITAESIDRLTGYPDAIPATSDPLTIVVEVIGVADPAIISLPSAVPEYIEADLDNGTPVLLSDLFTANRVDLDGSETLTMRVTGLPDGYALNQGTLVSNSSITGEDRIWVLNAAQLATAGIIAPVNANGEVVFSVTPVTTENDGNSRTGAPVDVRFTIAPSPEAEVTTSALMVEDEWRPLAIAIQHVNGDTDEVLEAIRIPVDLGAVSFTLSMNDGGSRLDLQDAGLTTVTEGGVEYYLIPGDRIAELEALPDPHLDGDLGGFDFQYQIRDPSNTPGTVDDGLLWKDGSFTLDALAVTDAPSLALVGFTGDFEPAGPNGILLNAPGRIGVDLNLSTPDADGSEKLVRILVENVPDGVTVEDTDGMQAELIGPGTWLLVYQGAEAQAITGGSLPQEVVFVVGPNAGSSEPGGIRITTQVQDNGEQGDPGTLIEQALVSFDLQTSFIGGDGEDPATIEEWSQNAFTATEDVTFTLADVMNAEVTQNSTEPNILTVTLTGLPAGTDITGMTRTVIEGVEVWSASTVTMTGGDAQAALDALLAGITITSPANVNSGNTGSPLPFDAQLTTAVVGSAGQDSQTAAVDIPVAPVTDPVDLTVALDGVPELTETATTIPLAITVANPADGANGVIENGNLYLQIDSGQAGLATGELTDALGNVIEPQTGSDISGLPAGLNPAATYYVVPGVTMGDTVQLVYTPDEMEAGAVTVTGWVENSETGSVTLLGDGSATFPVAISNNGVQVTAPPVTGAEAADIDPASQIELTGAGGLDFALIDNDGSEVIETIMLSNLPDGFLVFTGTSAGDASSAPMASNAGGASGLNTWVLYSADDGGSLPGYIAILPPKNWSGTLSDLSLLVTSGETTLTEKRTEEFEMGDITVEPVANGLTLIGTSSFGTEGSIIPLNLNAGVLDASAAVVSPLAPDETPGEAVTLQLTGLGEFASFYIGTTLRSAGVSYDEGSDTYTLTGLSQTDLDALGVLQAAPAAGTVRTITATAWTVDGADTSASATTSFTQNTTRQISTTGADTLLWNGRDINGRAGEDTVRFRLGEDLEGSTLAARLRGIEVLDLQIAGSNAITDLTPDQVRQITSGGNTLKVLGTAEDLVGLDGNWTETAPGLYSGTISSGGAPVTVTLEVTGASVTLPPAPFMMMFADPGEEDGLAFGFAALEAEPEAASTGAEPMDAEEIDMTGMLETGESEDLADLLPPEDPPAETTGPASGGREPAPADLSDPDLLRMTLEDELNASALAEA